MEEHVNLPQTSGHHMLPDGAEPSNKEAVEKSGYVEQEDEG